MNWQSTNLDVPLQFEYIAILAIVGLVVMVGLAVMFFRRPSSSSVASSEHTEVASLIGGGLDSGTETVNDHHEPEHQSPRRTVGEIKGAIETARAKSDFAQLASLNLEMGHAQTASGQADKAAHHFREAVIVASKHGFKDRHAAARLELAAIAEQSQDMTTACEHWQIARMLFHEMDQQNEVDETDRRMLRNGCPTDWVLTDF